MNDSFQPSDLRNEDELNEEAALRLDQLAEEFQARCNAGSNMSIQEFSDRHSDLAKDLTGLLMVIDDLKDLKAAQIQPEQPPETDVELPRQLGDFRILREIGRGGMGIVYEAEQLSLDRRVAVKILPHRSWQQREIQRFRREAKIAASFHHSNIVPIFAYGESEGYYYFAMQIIDGQALNKISTNLPEMSRLRPEITTPLWVAQAGRQIAEALHYAHQRHTLHRDIKPGNLLLDENGLVWISDFGVACFLAQDENDSIGPSGTLLYQAPERRIGKCDERSEVYSLGITLLEVALGVSGRKPESPAMTTSEACQILRSRKRIRLLPVDLQAVLRKAIQVDPELRYQTAAQMADDLQRYQEGRPVKARRASWMTSFHHWSVRNPLLAAALLTVAMLMCVTTGVLLASRIHSEQLNRQLTDANLALTNQNQSLTQASFAIDAFVRNAVANLANSSPKFQPSRSAEKKHRARLGAGVRSLLEGLTPEGLKLELINPRDKQEALLAVSAPRRVGLIMYSLGHLVEAEAAAKYSLELIQRASSIPNIPTDLLQLRKAQVLNDLADIEENSLRFQSAGEYRIQAFSELENITDRPDFKHYQFEFGRTHLGLIYENRYRWESLQALQEFLQICRKSTAGERIGYGPELKKHLVQSNKFLIAEQYRTNESVACNVLTGRCLIERSQNREALPIDRERDFKMGVHFLEIAALETAWNSRLVHEMARGLASAPLAGWDEHSPDHRSSSPYLNLACRLAGNITADSPKYPEFLATLAEASHKLAILASLNSDNKTAMTHFQTAIKTQTSLLNQFPENAHLSISKAVYLKSLAIHLVRSGAKKEAEETQQEALSELEHFSPLQGESEVWKQARLLIQSGIEAAQTSP